MEKNKRSAILKNHENDCYSICFYLLQCEKLACEAAENALYNLIFCDTYFVSDSHTQSNLLRKESMKSALQTKKKSNASVYFIS